MSELRIDASFKECLRHLAGAMAAAKRQGELDTAWEIEAAIQRVQAIRERYRTAHPNARMAGSCQQPTGAA